MRAGSAAVRLLGLTVSVMLATALAACFIPAWLLVASPATRPGTVRLARLALLLFGYLITFEIPVLARRILPLGQGDYRDELGRFFGPGLSLARMRLTRTTPACRAAPGRPVVVLVRHAGLFNVQIGVHLAATYLGLDPAGLVAKAVVRGDPANMALSREFIRVFWWNRAGRARAAQALGTMAASARAGQAVLLWPEGTNFTARRRARAIGRLRARGLTAQAEHASLLRHTLPPHLRGTCTLLAARPDADVVLIGHAGLEDVVCRRGGLGFAPARDGLLRVATWHFPAEEVPRGREAAQDWLLARWSELDHWVAAQKPGAVPQHSYAELGVPR